MIKSYLPPLFLVLALLFAAGQCASASASSSSVHRTIIVEPYFQIYEDQFELASAQGNYTVSFVLPYPQSLYSVKAYGPEHSELPVYVSWDETRGNLTLLVETNGASSFRLKTILHYTTTHSNSTYSTFLNLYPAVEEELAASLVLFTPSDSVLVDTPENLTSSSIDGKQALIGTAVLGPSAAYNATIKYTGTFELIEISALEHRISVGQNTVTVNDSLRLVNLNTSTINKVTFRLPEGASLVKVYDSISYMEYTLNGSELTVNLRTRLLPTEKTSFTVVYELPAASALESHAGKTVLSGDFLPYWCKYLVRNLVLVVELPMGSSEVSAPGFEITSGSSSIECRAQATDVTPHSGVTYSVSFVPAPVSVPVGTIAFAAILLAATLAVIAYFMIKRKRDLQKPPAQPAPPSSPPPPPPKRPRPRR
ncbi:MAG: hypothetical protein WHS82_00175 [Candidatus Methanosuratincola sp.]